MKISRDWLQTFFAAPLPNAAELAEQLTMHAFEIDGIEGEVLDVKVTPNRGHDCLSYRGIAKEVAAILDLPIQSDPFRDRALLQPATEQVRVAIDEPALCTRYIAAYITGVKVGQSPSWLRTRLEAMGQRSINNVVDATNYVMFHLGQPLHAFDAGQLRADAGVYSIRVRRALQGERMRALDDNEYTLGSDMLVISDDVSGDAIGIAGVKGGKPAAVSERTVDLIIESAHFNGVSVRKTAQALKLRTDASSRFEQGMSAEMAACGMRAAIDLILEIASGSLQGVADVYPVPESVREVSVTVEEVNAALGTRFQEADIADVFRRLDIAHVQEGSRFMVRPPFERLDLMIPEDLIEEVGRVKGYAHVPAVALPPLPSVAVNAEYQTIARVQDALVARGFSEVYTSVFADDGERVIANKVDGVRPFLRRSLLPGLSAALEKNVRVKDAVGVSQVKLFEIGTVWTGGREELALGIAVEAKKKHSTAIEELRAVLQEIGADEGVADEKGEVLSVPLSGLVRACEEGYRSVRLPNRMYRPFSKYPFIVRDIALWAASDTAAEDVAAAIQAAAGSMLLRIDLFDRFEKEGRISYAFRLVFQSFDRTLTDTDANERMESVYNAVRSRGWEVR